MKLKVRPGFPLHGDVHTRTSDGLPGDKSLSHRAALFAVCAEGESRIENFLDSGVTSVLLAALTQLGVSWTLKDGVLVVNGKGLAALDAKGEILYCGNSATTMRLLAGALAASGKAAVLDGSAGLRSRPMERIVIPLREMGVPISAAKNGGAPLVLEEREARIRLRSREIWLSQSSAQVKTCLLLAGLAAEGKTIVHEPAPSRDHSERMLRAMGVEVQQLDPLSIALTPPVQPLQPLQMKLPADFSAAAFLMVAALITPGSNIWLHDVGVNPGRIGLVHALRRMGGKIILVEKGDQGGEPIADIQIQSSNLQAIAIEGDQVVQMIDEFPIFAVAAALAKGRTQVKDAGELRAKESDRIVAIVKQLSKIGVNISERKDGFIIDGVDAMGGGEVDCHGDHRMAMSLAVAGLVCHDEIIVQGAEMVRESFPNFVELFQQLGATMEWQT